MEDKFITQINKRIDQLEKKREESDDLHVKISNGARSTGFKEIRQYYKVNVKPVIEKNEC